MTEEEIDRIYDQVRAIEATLPSLTRGGYASLAPWESKALNAWHAEERELRDDVYDRDDPACAATHLANLRRMAEEFPGEGQATT